MTQSSRYQEVLDFLFTQLPMYQRQGAAAYKSDLSNTIALCAALENPERKFKSVHLAGTNGKGTTAHTIASILQEAGYKTGLYTSPHLKDFRERIKINGQKIPEKEVVSFVNNNQQLIKELEPSFFEITVAMAFSYFANEEVDIAIIETGMGGRLDSTNVIDPILSVITTIGLDHQQFLGNTLEAIATEKAEIIKPNRPVVIADSLSEGVKKVFTDKAQSVGSELIDISINYQLESDNGQSLFRRKGVAIAPDDIPIKGEYYLKNLPLAIEAAFQLVKLEFGISIEYIELGIQNVISNTGLKGRWQVLRTEPMAVADVGHNEDGIKAIANQIERIPHNKLHLVWGTVNDKSVGPLLELLPKDAIYYFCQAKIPRALNVEQLGSLGQERGLKFELIPDVNEAYQKALSYAKSDDLIFVGGSTFVVAELEGL